MFYLITKLFFFDTKKEKATKSAKIRDNFECFSLGSLRLIFFFVFKKKIKVGYVKSYLPLFLLFLTSCGTQNSETQNKSSYEISGRDQERTPLYRIKAPKNWLVKFPSLTDDLQDTTKPLAEFTIEENEEKVHITIHNFLFSSKGTKIPPIAQIMRWKKQFDYLNPSSIHEKPQNFAGFVGLFFEGSGVIKEKDTTLFSWSMQISDMHYGVLENQERGASFTIKAVGPPSLMKRNKKEIIAFARSFELIDEIAHE